MDKNNLLIEDITKFKLLVIYDNSKTYSENLFLEQTAYERSLDRIFANPKKAQEYHDANSKMMKGVYDWFSTFNNHDWLSLIEISSGVLGLIPTPLSPLLLGISTVAGMADAYQYYTEGDYYMATMTAALSLIPGGELWTIFKNSKIFTKIGVDGAKNLIKKYKSGSKLLKTEVDDLSKLTKDFVENTPQIKKSMSKNLTSTLIKNLSEKSPKFLINLILILKKLGILKLSEISLKIGSTVYAFDKIYLFVFRDLIPNQKNLDQRTKNDLRAAINQLLGYEKEVNEYLAMTSKNGLEKLIKSGDSNNKIIDPKETPDEMFQEIIKQNSEKIKKSDKVPKKPMSPSFESVLSGNSLIRKGLVGDSVKKIQKMLYDLGYDYHLTNFETHTNWNDGDFGNYTQYAVETFQEDNSLTADGKVDKETLRKLIDTYKENVKNEN